MVIRFIVLGILLLCHANSGAQNTRKIDSLLNLVQNSTVDSVKINAYYHLSSLTRSDTLSSHRFADNGIEISKAIKDFRLLNLGYYCKGAIPSNDPISQVDLIFKGLQYFQSQKMYKETRMGYNNIGHQYNKNGNKKAAIHYFNLALDLAKSNRDTSFMVSYAQNLGIQYEGMGDYDSSLFYFKSGYHWAKQSKDEKRMSDLIQSTGLSYYHKGNYQLALECFLESLIVAEKMNDKVMLKSRYNNLGLLYKDMGEYDLAINFLQKALQLNYDTKSYGMVGGASYNIASIYLNVGQLDSAEKYLNLAFEYNEINSRKGGLSRLLLAGYAYIYKQRKNYDLAIEYYNKVVSICQENGAINALGGAYFHMADIYKLQYDYQTALDYNYNAIVIFNDINALEQLVDAYRVHTVLYKSVGKYDSSIVYYDKLIKLKDSLSELNQVNALAEMRTKYDTEQMEKDIQMKSLEFNSQMKMAALEQEKQKILLARNREQMFFLEHQNELKELELYKSESELGKKKAESQERLRQIELLDKERELKEAEAREKESDLKRQRWFTYTALGGVFFILLFLLLMIRAYRNKQKANRIITLQKDEVHRQKELVEEKQKEIIDSIIYAQRLQNAILTPESEIKRYFPDSFLLYKPKDIVAGDFYFFEVTDEHIFYAAADCTGHGVPGAMVSVVCSNALSRSVREFGLTNPGQILDKTTDLVLETFSRSHTEVKDGMDISLSVFNKSKQLNCWAGANNPLWVIRDGEFLELRPNKQPVGRFDYRSQFESHELPLKTGDAIYMFTDGYCDQFGGQKGKKFKEANLRKLLLSVHHLPMNLQKDKLIESILDWMGKLEQIDDICLIGVRV
jgi:serine phosphatase RsbU (regulator of sigma subunit)